MSADSATYDYPAPGEKVCIPLVSSDGREEFLLDLHRGRVALEKIKYQNRARQSIVLARLDVGGAPHRNPDGEEVPVPHLHLYREGYEDKWAFAVPADRFTDMSDGWTMLLEFMAFCNIVRPPVIERGLLV